jgi:hypothetical protein
LDVIASVTNMYEFHPCHNLLLFLDSITINESYLEIKCWKLNYSTTLIHLYHFCMLIARVCQMNIFICSFLFKPLPWHLIWRVRLL